MPSDEELRKVAEDVRALARSLARDLRQAADTARRSGQFPVDPFAHRRRRHGRGGQWRSFGPPDSYGGPGRPWWHGGWPPGWPEDSAGQPDTEAPSGAAPPGTPPPGPSWGPRRVQGPGFVGPSPWASHRAYRKRSRARYGPYPPPAAPAAPVPVAAPRLPPVRRRWDATAVAGTLALLIGGAWLLGLVGAAHPSVESVAACLLIFLGVASIVTARTDWSLSRHSWPVWAGVVLVLTLVATSSSYGIRGTLHNYSVGDMTRVATGSGTYYGGVGKLNVDATAAPAGAQVTVYSFAGQTVIDTPPGLPLRVDARVDGGNICVEGKQQGAGALASVGSSFPAPGSGASASSGTALAPVVVTVRQVAGQILIDGSGCDHR